ncbi:MAG TPA: hypothetical protein VK052_04880 [Zeimonas sp.]|nr:hypothetical protein [Zeimonas sp.]
MTNLQPMTTLRRLLITLALALLPAASHAQFQAIGTIEATIDGKTMTWYVPGRNAGDDGSAGAMWMSMQPGTGKAVIGGYESRDTTFGRDPATGKPTVSGQGSQVIITFDFPERASDARFGLPAKGAHDVSVWVLPTIGDHAGMQVLNAGNLSVSRIEARRSGASRFEGSFSGTISDRAGKVKRAIANGRFTVDGAVFFDPAGSKGARN